MELCRLSAKLRGAGFASWSQHGLLSRCVLLGVYNGTACWRKAPSISPVLTLPQGRSDENLFKRCGDTVRRRVLAWPTTGAFPSKSCVSPRLSACLQYMSAARSYASWQCVALSNTGIPVWHIDLPLPLSLHWSQGTAVHRRRCLGLDLDDANGGTLQHLGALDLVHPRTQEDLAPAHRTALVLRLLYRMILRAGRTFRLQTLKSCSGTRIGVLRGKL